MYLVMSRREASKSEYQKLKQATAELWKERVKQGVKTTTAYAKAGAWTVASGFNRIVNKVTSEEKTEALSKASKIGAAFTVGAIFTIPLLPALPIALGAATIGSYMAGKIGQALHGITQENLIELDDKAINAQLAAEEANEAYETAKDEHLDMRDDKREAFGEVVEDTLEEVGRKVQGIGNAISEEYNEIKEKASNTAKNVRDGVVRAAKAVKGKVDQVNQNMREGWNEFKQDTREMFDATKKKAQDTISSVKTGVQNAWTATTKKVKEVNTELQLKKIRRKVARDNARYARKLKLSERCLDFLQTSTICLGKDWITENLLTDADKKKYEDYTTARDKLNEKKSSIEATREEERKQQIQDKIDKLRAEYGDIYNSLTVEKYDKLSKAKKAAIENDFDLLKYKEQEDEM